MLSSVVHAKPTRGTRILVGPTVLCNSVTDIEGCVRASTYDPSSIECCGSLVHVCPLCSAEKHAQHEMETQHGDAKQRQPDRPMLMRLLLQR